MDKVEPSSNQIEEESKITTTSYSVGVTFEDFVIIDSIKTIEHRQLSVDRRNLPIPLLNPACGADWKKAIYIVGGECHGEPSFLAYKFDFQNFGFNILKELDEHLSMAALTTV
jgi:hypothetical protein